MMQRVSSSLMAGVVLSALLVAALPAAAQEPALEVPSQGRFLVRASPIALMFTTYKLGAELAVTPRVAADLVVNHNPSFLWSEVAITTAMAGARFYPAEMFDGFSVAGALGMIRFAHEGESASYPLLSLEVAHSWLLGQSRRFYVGSGIGAGRMFASGSVDFDTEGEEDFDWSANVPVPSWRLSLGYRF